MLNKKTLWIAGAGAAALSIAVAITVNIVTPDKPTAPQQPEHLSCAELQQAIDNLGKPSLSQLPAILRNDIEWIRVRDFDCHLNGKNWTLAKGKIELIHKSKQVDVTQGTNPAKIKF